MTKISFTDAHLSTIETALEVYARLKLGQFDIAIDEAFPEADLSWEERRKIHGFLRGIVLPEAPSLRHDGHGGYVDQYYNFYGEDRELDCELDCEQKAFLKRANKGKLQGLNSSYGVCSEEIYDGNLAYEIRQTIRQYLTVKSNDGFFNYMNVSFDDPLKVTEEPLPVIEGFEKSKTFVVEDSKINNQLNKLFKEKKPNWQKMWELVENNCQNHENIESSHRQINFNKDAKKWELILEKPIKKKQQNELQQRKNRNPS